LCTWLRDRLVRRSTTRPAARQDGNPADQRYRHDPEQQVCLEQVGSKRRAEESAIRTRSAPRRRRPILAATTSATAAAVINADDMTTNPAPAVPWIPLPDQKKSKMARPRAAAAAIKRICLPV
jgi:hypothetical protein